uniref:Ig-like domain-containing protein n=1 Tax=Labrus bergylta TaxID=56723 RepID=A0A3Q3GTL9_9LABR
TFLRKEMDEVTTKLGQPAVMKCQIIGRPVPDIKWYHAGKEIVESRKYEMSSDGRNNSLSIMTDQQEDEGQYTCKGINDAGEAETTGMLVLEAASSFHPDYPLKETYYAGLGSTLRVHAVYIGRPEPKIMWLQGSKTLENTEDTTIETTEHYTHLVIKNVQRRLHGGKYRIRLAGYFFRVYAQNRYGNSEPLELTSPILIKSQLGMFTPIFVHFPLVHLLTTDEIKQTVFSVKRLTEGLECIFRVKCENVGGQSDYSEETAPIIPATAVEVRAPAFKEELRNMSVKHKSNATLVCKITGQPKPVIKWFRRGKEIHSDGKKIKIQEFKGGYHQLVITEADEEDSTVYQIRATNQGGSICATVSLDVEGKLIDTHRYLPNIPAKINLPKNLKDKEIPFGGKPDPVITWQKGQDLIDSNGHYQVIKKDAGFYIVCAKNRFGIDQQTVELDVADVPDPPRGVTASDVSRDSVSLNWVAPANDGGSKVVSYIIENTVCFNYVAFALLLATVR